MDPRTELGMTADYAYALLYISLRVLFRWFSIPPATHAPPIRSICYR